MNNNVNNEQEMILKQKIEKREKFDTILAYVLLVILLGCIVLVLYLKFVREEEEVPPVDEYVPNYISLSEISSSLNSSTLFNRYFNDGAIAGSSVSNDSLMVTYAKEDANINLEIPVIGNELVVDVSGDNTDIITDIYEEIANIICVYYGNEEKYCRNTLDNMPSNGLDGIRIDVNEDTTTVYITTTKSFTVLDKVLYSDVIISDINVSDYSLQLLNIEISNINISTSDVNIVFTGDLEKLVDDTSNVSVVVKLYDVDSNVIGEKEYEFNEENVLEVLDSFEVNFEFNDTLKLENIDKYSIEIVK